MSSMNPTHYIHSSDFICKQWLPAGFNLYQAFPIRVSTVVSPSNFWVQMEGPSYLDRLEELEYSMDKFYQNVLSPVDVFFESLREIKEKRYGVIVYQNRIRRVRVQRLQLIGNRIIATVFHVDYGMITREDCDTIMRLNRKFASFPQQAIWATLANTVPINNALPWSLDDSTRFAYMVQDKQIEAQLVGAHMYKMKMHLILNDISIPGEGININDALVEEGFAEVGTTINFENDDLD